MSTSAAQIRARVRPSIQDSSPELERRSPTSKISRGGLGYALATLSILAGFKFSEGYYLTAESGWGYALGIIGGVMMLALLLYPLRKRYSSLSFLGPVSYWFKSHMFLGVLGPILILYHASFNMGSTNSSIAMICMLLVAGSGIIGRYIYTKIHNGLYGRRTTLEELRRQTGDHANNVSGLTLFPDLVSELHKLEQDLMQPANKALVALNPFIAGFRARFMQWRFARKAEVMISRLAEERPVIATHADRLERLAGIYGERRLQAARRVAQFDLFERMFSMWHVLHFPLFLMMVLTAIVHVVAVHLY